MTLEQAIKAAKGGELLPCPWCEGDGDITIIRGGVLNLCLNCTLCGCSGPWAPNKEQAIKDWNTRNGDLYRRLCREVAAAASKWIEAHDAVEEGVATFELHNGQVDAMESALKDLREALRLAALLWEEDSHG